MFDQVVVEGGGAGEGVRPGGVITPISRSAAGRSGNRRQAPRSSPYSELRGWMLTPMPEAASATSEAVPVSSCAGAAA
ncbi:hypothetical protein, partial [Bordetella bronchiseptica]|uniref:hypothetical protein n=1 Tax=Bordetella bronchiseptica TaxID=518 RepID=UPI0005B47F27